MGKEMYIVYGYVEKKKIMCMVTRVAIGFGDRSRKLSFPKTLFKPEFETSAFSEHGKHFENGAFRKR